MVDFERLRTMVAGDQGLAMVSIARGDGSVQTSLVNAGITAHPVSGDAVAGLVVRGSSHKLALLAANPWASVSWRVGWDWTAIEGPVEVCGPDHPLGSVDPDAIPTLLRTVFKDAGGTHDNWDEYDKVMADERRTAVFITPERQLGR